MLNIIYAHLIIVLYVAWFYLAFVIVSGVARAYEAIVRRVSPAEMAREEGEGAAPAPNDSTFRRVARSVFRASFVLLLIWCGFLAILTFGGLVFKIADWLVLHRVPPMPAHLLGLLYAVLIVLLFAARFSAIGPYMMQWVVWIVRTKLGSDRSE